MKPLFSTEGRNRLADIVRPGLLCAFDFDGTLAPIVSMPDHACMPNDIREHLIALSVLAPVAIITGRALRDISSRLGFVPDFVIGNHGMEGMPGAEADAARHEAQCSAWREQLGQALHGSGLDRCAQIEDKGFSLSVHYRHARAPNDAARTLEQLFAQLAPPPRVVAGKFVFNLVPQDARDKGGALEQLMLLSGARNAIYVGDDVTDEDVFRLRRPDLVSVRIEQAAGSAADFFLPRSQDILQLVRELTDGLRAAGAENWLQTSAGA